MKVYRLRTNDFSAKSELLATGPGDSGWSWDRDDGSETFSIGVDTVGHPVAGKEQEYNYSFQTDSRVEMVKIVTQLLRIAACNHIKGPSVSGKMITEMEIRVDKALIDLGIKDKWGSTIE